ncbi:MAG: hypothetical protein F7C35_05710 [Desulfurococcales archaeon]|nr:hypothetical protein [Desulfurococcales archaeon]
MEPWQAWAILAVLTAMYAKARILVHDAARAYGAYRANDEEEYYHYTAAAMVDAFFILLLLILLLKII